MISLWLTAKLENVLLEISRTESEVEEEEEEEELSTASGPFEIAGFPSILGQSERSEDEAGSSKDLKTEEEEPEPCTLLTGQGDFEEERPETEEEGGAAGETALTQKKTQKTHPEENREAGSVGCSNPA